MPGQLQVNQRGAEIRGGSHPEEIHQRNQEDQGDRVGHTREDPPEDQTVHTGPTGQGGQGDQAGQEGLTDRADQAHPGIVPARRPACTKARICIP